MVIFTIAIIDLNRIQKMSQHDTFKYERDAFKTMITLILYFRSKD